VGDAVIIICDYWQGVHWHEVQQWGRVVIGEECAGRRCNNRVGRLLARSALAEDATIEVHGY